MGEDSKIERSSKVLSQPVFTVLVISIFSLFFSPLSASASGVYKYTVEKEIGFDKFIIEEYPFGDQYLIEKGIGCLSLWRYSYRPFLIDVSGWLDGIGDTIILPDDGQSCRVWDADEISSSGSYLTPLDYGLLAALSAGSSNTNSNEEVSQPKTTPKPKVQGATTGISEADRKAPDFIKNETVPPVVDHLFTELFGRKPTPQESTYWKGRARSDKATESKLKGAMLFQKSRGSTIPNTARPSQASVTSASKDAIRSADVPAVVDREFMKVFGHKPTIAESAHWKARARSDKKTISALRGAMQFQKNKTK